MVAFGLGDAANLELTVECVKNSLEFTQGRKITEVGIFMHVHADEIRYLDRS
jgi:hypothetical protein